MDCTGNGGPGHSIQLGQRRVRQLQPQADQGDQHPVDEDQLVIRPGTGRPLTVVAAPFVERRLALCRPRASHFLDQIAEMCTIKAAEDRMGLDGVRSDIAMMRTPDGHSKLELTKYHTPAVSDAEPRNPPPNTLGLHRVMFAVHDIDDTIARLRAHGAELLGEVAQYENIFRLCNLRGPAGIIVALAEQIG